VFLVVAYSPPSCGLPKGHDRQHARHRHDPALVFEIVAFNLTGQLMSDEGRSHWLGPPLLAVLLVAGPVQAQIVTDGSVGPKVSLSGGEIKIGADLGSRRGDNLFHSFEKFGIASGQSATFTGPGTIKNVISRVTGGEISNIDGKLASTVGQADLYFLNPAGVIFGPNATLDVPGSFHVSTAHELRFADGARFSALDKTGSGLTVAPPEAFGFLDKTPGRIAADGSRLEFNPGQTFSLIGGDISLFGGAIAATGKPSGTSPVSGGAVNLASVASPGRVRVSDATVEATQLGSIRLTGQGITADDSGTVRIRGGNLIIDGSSIIADTTGERNSGGGIDLQAGLLTVQNRSRVTTNARGSGRSGTITVEAAGMMINGRTVINSDTWGNGTAGSVRIRANHLEMSGGGSFIGSDVQAGSSGNAGDVTVNIVNGGLLELIGGPAIESDTRSRSSGNAGKVTVTAGTITLTGGSTIRSGTQGSGAAGAVSVQADGGLTLTGVIKDRSGNVAASSNIASNALDRSTGNAGNVTVEAGDLTVRDGASIASITRGRGRAGAVNVRADRIFASEDGSGNSTGIQSDAGTAITGPTGPGGTITVSAREVMLYDGGIIQSETWGEDAGMINVQTDRLVISGLGNTGILSRARRNPRTGNAATGNAGNITVRAGQLELHDGGGIRTDTQSTGRAGTINVVADSLLIVGLADTGKTLMEDSGITSNARPGSTGNAGDVTVTARELVVRGGGPRSVAGISSATAAGASGNAGTVSVSGRSIVLANGAKISTENASRGTGGPVRLNASDTLTMDRAEILAQTTTQEGGDVTVAVGRLFDLHDSELTTSVAGGTGSGGDITIKSFLMVVDGSDIVARAQKGHGGSIKIEAGQFIQTPDATINASSAESISGTITIAAPNIDIAGSLVVLPETFLDASSQLRETCAARGGRPASSFSAGGRGGLPPDPGAPLPASSFEQPPGQQTATRAPTAALTAEPPRAVNPITIAGIPQPVLGSPRLTCRG
jgi:filamentous hemagglutinin family protein